MYISVFNAVNEQQTELISADHRVTNIAEKKNVTEGQFMSLAVFLLNNQPDALIIQILFCYKTLHVSGILSDHHQEFSTVHSALVSFMQV